MKLSRLLSSIAEKEANLALQEARAAENEARLSALVAFHQDAKAQMEHLRATAEADAKREAARIVAETRRATEQLVASIRRSQADRETIRAAHRQLDRMAQNSTPETTPAGSGEPASAPLSVGMTVSVDGLSAPGEILHLSDDGRRVSVLVGRVTHIVARARVRPHFQGSGGGEQGRGWPSEPSEPGPAGAYEIDLRGRSVDEARLELEDLLEPLQRQGIRSVRVIHGRGTGVLRRELQSWFRSHPLVESQRRGGPGEGGDGVTVLTLKAP